MVKVIKKLIISLSLGFWLIKPGMAMAEYKSEIPSGQNIPKLAQTADDPKLMEGHVYPNWGPICQRYTYSVIYVDEKNRPPEYVKIYFNGQMIEMEKEDPEADDYVKGVKYVYKYVPNKLGSNFYFFEASNGLGKARDSIIESPDNGPVLFKSAFDKNEIAVIEIAKKEKILSYEVGEEWVGGVALSDDGQYLAAKTNKRIYLFETAKPEKPKWVYEGAGEMPGDVKGGVAMAGDGSRIFASIGGKAILFNNKSNQPIWVYQGSGNQAYNVAMAKDGKYMAMGTAGEESNPQTNLLILWNEKSEKPLWQYHAAGNFHDVALSDDGSFITGATGCPDRRFYLFSKESNQPMIRSEMLTRDSPVHRAKISADGQYAAVGSESGDGAVFLFSKDSDRPRWKFSTPDRSSVRALSFTPDGEYIGAATFKGDVYIFEQASETPVSHWQVGGAMGGVDIADDGSLVAVGGTDNKLHLFEKGDGKVLEVDFKEYVEEIDISAGGEYVAVGTGGSVYFFEAFDEQGQQGGCREIREPVPEKERMNQERGGVENDDWRVTGVVEQRRWPGMLLGFGFWGSMAGLAGYIVIVKKKGGEVNKKVLGIIGGIGAVFLILTIVAAVMNKRSDDGQLRDRVEEETGCGNGMCEPDFGETRENCAKDCSGSD